MPQPGERFRRLPDVSTLRGEMILLNLLIGSVMVVLTTLVHAAAMIASLKWLGRTRKETLKSSSFLARSFVVAVVVLIMFVATILEAGIWASLYCVLGAIEEFEAALYFSMVTFTTLGFGDVVAGDGWRLLSSLEAANGILMFGWTTAIIILGVRRVSRHLDLLVNDD